MKSDAVIVEIWWIGDFIFMQFLKIFITATDPNGNNPSVVPPLSGATWP